MRNESKETTIYQECAAPSSRGGKRLHGTSLEQSSDVPARTNRRESRRQQAPRAKHLSRLPFPPGRRRRLSPSQEADTTVPQREGVMHRRGRRRAPRVPSLFCGRSSPLSIAWPAAAGGELSGRRRPSAFPNRTTFWSSCCCFSGAWVPWAACRLAERTLSRPQAEP